MRNPSGQASPLSQLPSPTPSLHYRPRLPLQAAAALSPQPSQAIWRVLFSSESACDRHGKQQREARAGGCALVGQAWPLSPLGSGLAALMETETLARTVPVLPLSTGRRKHFPWRLQLLPCTQSQRQTSPPRRHPRAEAGACSGTSPMAPAKPCQHQRQGQERQKQRLGDLHSEEHLT